MARWVYETIRGKAVSTRTSSAVDRMTASGALRGAAVARPVAAPMPIPARAVVARTVRRVGWGCTLLVPPRAGCYGSHLAVAGGGGTWTKGRVVLD
ncbi:hypothetical protein GCM10020000_60990 [Streptomyces olivoverticillatus]